MTKAAGHRNLLRRRQEHEHGKVTFVELFLDLVAVGERLSLRRGQEAGLSSAEIG